MASTMLSGWKLKVTCQRVSAAQENLTCQIEQIIVCQKCHSYIVAFSLPCLAELRAIYPCVDNTKLFTGV